ncbi:hypothetical protein EON77_17225, partial [bacterium]
MGIHAAIEERSADRAPHPYPARPRTCKNPFWVFGPTLDRILSNILNDPLGSRIISVMSIKDLERIDRETTLILRAQRGDVSAFDALVGEEWTPMVAFAQARLGGGQFGAREDAEDAVLRAFLKAHAAIGGFDAERPLRPWLRTIVAN